MTRISLRGDVLVTKKFSTLQLGDNLVGEDPWVSYLIMAITNNKYLLQSLVILVLIYCLNLNLRVNNSIALLLLMTI